MRKIHIGLLLLLILLTGCSKKTESDVVFDGIVIAGQNNSILIAAADKSYFQSFEPISVSYEGNSLDVNKGDLVEIGFDGVVMESYPSQIRAESVVIKEKATSESWPGTQILPEDYPSDKAKEDGCFVVALDGVYSVDKLEAFVQNTQMGIAGYLRKVTYTVEGDPIITDIFFDGQSYYVVSDSTRDQFAGEAKFFSKEYSFLNVYEKDTIYDVYLTDQENITEEEYEANISGGTNSNIEYYSLYYVR